VIHVKVTIGDKATPALRKLRKAIPPSLKKTIESIAKDVRNTAMASMLQPKHGIVYRKGTLTEHRASAPGEAPASDTGDLLNSITVASRRNYTDVGSEKLHGLFMEKGTKRVKKRPYLAPALKKHAPKLERVLLAELKRRSR
jgi:hypothetical protein